MRWQDIKKYGHSKHAPGPAEQQMMLDYWQKKIDRGGWIPDYNLPRRGVEEHPKFSNPIIKKPKDMRMEPQYRGVNMRSPSFLSREAPATYRRKKRMRFDDMGESWFKSEVRKGTPFGKKSYESLPGSVQKRLYNEFFPGDTSVSPSPSLDGSFPAPRINSFRRIPRKKVKPRLHQMPAKPMNNYKFRQRWNLNKHSDKKRGGRTI